MIAFRASSDYGNSLYIDNVRLEVNNSVEGLEQLSGVRVYPSPAQERATLEFRSNTTGRISVMLLDGAGRSVAEVTEGSYAAGSHKVDVATEHLAAGVYYLQIKGAAGSMYEKLVVGK